MRRVCVFIACVLFVSNLSAQTLLLYYSPQCPYSKRVLDYLASIHKSVPLKNVVGDPQAKEELRRIGGKAQVPCLIIDGSPMYESQDIIRWFSTHKDALENISYKGRQETLPTHIKR